MADSALGISFDSHQVLICTFLLGSCHQYFEATSLRISMSKSSSASSRLSLAFSRSRSLSRLTSLVWSAPNLRFQTKKVLALMIFSRQRSGDFLLALLLLQNPDHLLVGRLSCFHQISFLRRGASPLQR
jgi:hypothetical protein